jgi:lysophospholipid acyltransferase (LPLAT)-like uncharacterized protein
MKNLIKKIGKAAITQRVASHLIASYMRLILITSRKIYLQHKPSSIGGKLMPMWHGRIFLFPALREKDGKYCALTSRNRDGGWIEEILARFGIKSVRGSSNKGGVRSLILLKKDIEAGYNVIVTPDGPRGPLMQLKEGVSGLTKITKAPLFLCCFSAKPAINFKTWDKFHLPLPFAKIYIEFLPFAYDPEDEDLQNKIEKAMQEQVFRLDKMHD